MRPDYNKLGVFGARRTNVTGCEHESPVSKVWHCQNPSKAASSASTRPASGGCRFITRLRAPAPNYADRCNATSPASTAQKEGHYGSVLPLNDFPPRPIDFDRSPSQEPFPGVSFERRGAPFVSGLQAS